tara:strand:+ start:387 stop:656 length:270 start_codon:yes stop_codon:yes gene_type:complete
MKKLLLLAITGMFLMSCGGGDSSSKLSACDCASLSQEAITAGIANPPITPEQKEAFEKKWDKKVEPCTKQANENPEFEKEWRECMEKNW